MATHPVTSAPGISFPFLELPPELRIAIYERLFDCRSRLFTPVRRHPGSSPLCECAGKVLFLVSRQIRAETQPILLGRHEVHLVLLSDRRQRTQDWLASLTDGAIGAIRTLVLKTFAPPPEDAAPAIFVFDLDAAAVKVSGPSFCVWGSGPLGKSWKVELLKKHVPPLLAARVEELPERNGRKVLTREALEEMMEMVGWSES